MISDIFCNIALAINKILIMDTLSLRKATSLFILTLIQRDDGQKNKTLETPTNGTCV